MNPELPSTQPSGHLGPSLVDAFSEFWHAGEGPKHDVIDRKIAAAGLPVPPDGSKERKIVGAFLAANDDQAYLLMRGLLDALRKFSKGQYSKGELGAEAGVELRKAIESAGYALNENFELTDESKNPAQVSVPQPAWGSSSPWIPSVQTEHTPPAAQLTPQEKVAIHHAEAHKTPPQEIFLVHGHDELEMHKVSDWVHELTGVKPTILSKQISSGMTLVEKFETYSSDAACAIILMTPDDEARAKRDQTSNFLEQARQNVVFELGYFYGKLQRKNVIVLNFGVELPGDIKGLVYIGKSKWEVQLAKELAGLGYKTF